MLQTPLFAQTWYTVPANGGKVGIPCDSPCANCSGVHSLKTINGVLYVGGSIGPTCGATGKGISKYNGSSWDSLGPGVYGIAEAFELYNGEIYAAGSFLGAYSGLPWPNDWVQNTEKIARWDGMHWKAVSSGAGAGPSAPTELSALKYYNDLYIAGNSSFQSIGGITCKHIARWNGSTYNNVQGGVDGPFFPEVYAMEIYKGQLYVGGNFTMAGNITANYIARWDGTKWDSVGRGMDYFVEAFAVDTVNDILYAGGAFTNAGGISSKYIAKWDGTNWSAVAPFPPVGYIKCLKIFKGELYAGSYGNLSLGDTVLLRYDGSQWHPVWGPNWSVVTLETYKGNLYVGGGFDKIDTTTVNGIACYGDSCPGTPITLTQNLGVHEYNTQLKFKVYPNPAKKELNIEVTTSPQPSQKERGFLARVKNSLGQSIFEQKFEKALKINTSGFKQGIYFVEVCTSEGKLCHTEKVVVE